LWWCCRYVKPLINPLSLEVVMRDDWAQHALGWLYFRNQGLSFPLGKLPNFLYPVGTTVGYMDAIPWVALTLRPFSALLPESFQYLGLWIALCSASLAFVAARIASGVTPHWEQQALVGALTAMAPTLITRIVHPALCGHTFVVTALALNLMRTDTAAEARRVMGWALLVVVLGSATHPYFAVMPLALLFGLPWRLRRQLGPWVASVAALCLLGCAATVLTALGYLGGGMNDQIDGFGTYSANLNALFNSMGHSRIFHTLDYAPSQYEGYGYLGAGVFLMMAAAVLTLLWPRARRRVTTLPWRRAGWPLLAAVACAVFAFASPIRWGEREVLSLGFYEHLHFITDAFRSSGRFIWPLAYCVVIGSALTVVAALRPYRWVLSAVLAAAVGLQGYDLQIDNALDLFKDKRTGRLVASEWSLASHEYKHLVLYPPQVLNACGKYHARFVSELAYLAYRNHWTFNSGYAARYRPAQHDKCKELEQRVEQGELREDELYVLEKRDVRRFVHAGAVCGKLDGLRVCAVRKSGEFVDYLSAQR
jgi:hypothetical protein